MSRIGRVIGGLKRPLPAWLLVSVIVGSALTVAGVFLGSNYFGPKGDFVIQSSLNQKPTLLDRNTPVFDPGRPYLDSGNYALFNITVRSINNFTGVVSLSAKFPAHVNGSIFTNSQGNHPVILLGISDTATIMAFANLVGNYTITVSGASGKISHSVNLSLVVQGIGFAANPPIINVARPQAESIITLSSQNGLSGSLYVQADAIYYPTWATVSPSTVYLPEGGSATVTVSASSVYYVPGWKSTIDFYATVNFFGPNRQTLNFNGISLIMNESLTLQNFIFESNTNVTLGLENDGVFGLITGYSVGDGIGDLYSCSYNCISATAIIPPLSVTPLSTPIGASCPKCVLTGRAFNFAIDQSYTITIGIAGGTEFEPAGSTFTFSVQRQ